MLHVKRRKLNTTSIRFSFHFIKVLPVSFPCITLVLAFTLFSCNHDNKVPGGIIKPPQMQAILWDLMRGDVFAEEIIKNDSTQNLKSASYTMTENIFALHNTDRAQFQKSLSFYEKHPVLIKTIFDSLNSVQSRRKSLEPGRRPPIKDYRLIQGKKIP